MAIGRQPGGLWYVYDTLSGVVKAYSADLAYLIKLYPDAKLPW